MYAQKIRKYCAYQDRSIAEVRSKLKGLILTDVDIENIVTQLIDEDYLNDRRFAENFVKSKLTNKGWGIHKIRFHLKQKGISEDIIHSVLNDIDDEEWNIELQKNINKWERSNELTQATFPKLVRFLLSKGNKLPEIMKKISFSMIFLVILFLSGCKTPHNISYLQQNTYYTTTINHQPHIIEIDTIIYDKKSKIKEYASTVYLIGSNEFTKPQRFQVNYYHRKPKAKIDGKSISFSNTYTVYEFPKITEFPNRFLDTLFKTQVIRNVAFAQVEGFWDFNFASEDEIGKALLGGIVSTFRKKNLNLKMDIYMPLNAGKYERPLLMLIHGGAFYIGDKSEQAIAEVCRYFASLGYTTASINYRMGFQPTKASIERTGYMAVQDAHAAMRFLIANAGKYRVNPEYLFVGGTSAGGITALYLAFMQNKDRPESSFKSLINNDLGNIEAVGKNNDITFQIKSVANLWGAVNNLNLLKNNNVSVLSYHGVKDPIVPYDYDYPMQKTVKKGAPLLFSKMYGSKPIHKELNKLGYREKLVSINIEAHTLWETDKKLNDTFYRISNDMKLFFYHDLVPNPMIIEQDIEFKQQYFISNPDIVDNVTWQCEGGFIINKNNKETDKVFVIWRIDRTNRKLIASGTYKNGATFKTEISR
ncbi:MAG: RecX family transcriptional regulator [Bacteroidales bacterium]|jgi:SOS response regulatory protein OraA/RecX/pimeloyl-ACP methyl ester carboxylesterase|nr:RecX family transcriptional regulator [Bacteroidales bacterium]